MQRTLQREGAEVHFEFNEIGAVVATLSQDAITRLKESGAVKYIEPDHKRYPMGSIVPYGIDLVQARDVWDSNRDGSIDAGAPTGEGVTVCVIDSGLTAGHQDFANIDVIGGYPEGWDNDRCGHGTHVAGSIAADFNGEGVVGVSPGAVSLYIVKVFGNSSTASCQWSYSSTLVDAAQRCADAGASVINMSLGGGGSSTAEGNAFQALRDQGVLSVAAAGNGGDTSLSFPASYDAVVSVGGVDSQKNHYTASQRNAQVELAAPGVGVLSTVGYSDSDFSVAGSGYMVGAMDGTVEATASGDLAEGGLCLEALSDVDGKIVLCERGQISFADKALNAVAGGAAGVVVYNNAPGGFSGTLGGVAVSVPVLSLSQEDGQALVADSLGMSASVSTIFTYPANGYDTYSGTSMASPHVAGAAAVAWSEDPELSLTQVLHALIAGAEDLGAEGRDHLFGHGLIQLKDTIDIIRSGDIPEPPPPPPPPPPPESTALVNGELVELDPIPGGQWARYYIDVPAGAENLVMELRPLEGATGDGDIYVRFGDMPSTTEYDCVRG
ncbi:S8 family serine peptidase [Alkalisalibacterium limincola]|nr:S8 family serine peptidase [Alkalisalibacterium limincola]